MQIVIDIPEEIYNHTQRYEVGGFNQENDTKLFMAIKNGIPLPKGHGDLIDVDALTPDYLYENGEFHAVGVVQLQYAPRIIPADKNGDCSYCR